MEVVEAEFFNIIAQSETFDARCLVTGVGPLLKSGLSGSGQKGAGRWRPPVWAHSDFAGSDKQLQSRHRARRDFAPQPTVKARIDDGSLALVVADTLPAQMDLLKAGLSKGQVGQRPFEMGYKTMLFLKEMKDGKPAPKDPTYTGLDVCTPQNAASCVGSGS